MSNEWCIATCILFFHLRLRWSSETNDEFATTWVTIFKTSFKSLFEHDQHWCAIEASTYKLPNCNVNAHSKRSICVPSNLPWYASLLDRSERHISNIHEYNRHTIATQFTHNLHTHAYTHTQAYRSHLSMVCAWRFLFVENCFFEVIDWATF